MFKPTATEEVATVGTFGLTHIALAVRDPARSAAFYSAVFGCVETWSSEGWIEVTTPGCHDIISFRSDLPNPGKSAGVVHFGFRLRAPKEIGGAVAAVEKPAAGSRSRANSRPGIHMHVSRIPMATRWRCGTSERQRFRVPRVHR